MNTKVLGTIPEGQKATGLGRTMIYQLIGEGKLEAIKCGRRRLLVWRSVEKLADTLRVEA